MTKYTLHYFNLKGRGEIVRLMLVAAGVDFEDHRVEREEWPKLKPSRIALFFCFLGFFLISFLISSGFLRIHFSLNAFFGTKKVIRRCLINFGYFFSHACWSDASFRSGR
jgi:hypothetical protein